MKNLIALFLLCSFSFSTFAQFDEKQVDKKAMEKKQLPVKKISEEAVQSKATINFENDIHDFGDIDEGPKVNYSFAFTNSGTEPLILSNVKASCGCTVPTWPREPIMPGAQGVIEVTYNTERRPGNFNKAITITSNAQTPTKVIYIKGNVKAHVEEETLPVKEKSILTPDGM